MPPRAGNQIGFGMPSGAQRAWDRRGSTLGALFYGSAGGGQKGPLAPSGRAIGRGAAPLPLVASFFLVVRPGAPGSFFAPSSDARSP